MIVKYLIGTDETITEIKGRVTLNKAQKIVGGDVELVPWVGRLIHAPGMPGVQILVNSEGLMHNLPFNRLASLMLCNGTTIVGNAILLTGRDIWTT